MSPKPLQSNWRSPSSMDKERVKKIGWLSDGILVVDRNDPKLTWDIVHMIDMVGNALYGERVK